MGSISFVVALVPPPSPGTSNGIRATPYNALLQLLQMLQFGHNPAKKAVDRLRDAPFGKEACVRAASVLQI